LNPNFYLNIFIVHSAKNITPAFQKLERNNIAVKELTYCHRPLGLARCRRSRQRHRQFASLARGLIAGQPNAEESGDGDHPQGHLAQADHFFEGWGHQFFVAGIQVKVRDLDS